MCIYLFVTNVFSSGRTLMDAGVNATSNYTYLAYFTGFEWFS